LDYEEWFAKSTPAETATAVDTLAVSASRVVEMGALPQGSHVKAEKISMPLIETNSANIDKRRNIAIITKVYA